MNNSTVVGIDIGGSHITAALVNIDSGSLLLNSLIRKSVDSSASPEEIIGAWSEVIRSIFDNHSLSSKKIGIAMPGPFDYQQGISLIKNQGKFENLYGLNIKELLAKELSVEVEDIRLANDAGCFLKGEVVSGAAKGYQQSVGITLGTGLGSAHYQNGVAGDAALWQHPFKEGIAEDYLCTRWFIKRYHQLSGRSMAGVKEIMELASTDPLAKEVFEEFGKNLASFLSFFIEKDKPEVVVLGGNISNAYNVFKPELIKSLEERGITIPILKAMLGEKASLIGAASSWTATLY